ncbi:predicted protein [Aspergillus nidulans FGSC A4]|uniref:Uncharacterized protein n=1 Tax=Emericella nidulans (strain FGSC A4 / ATCC 38163 / CBS 112.46 / NRRL 194 / M139) TaxID=227321 RepID=Q5AQL3_EMENI|nr:predicted protein [Aspergillus nidulans FGSC A4]CBF74300.1 TPA: hypothetical protein ANIA_09417 [Aspergillus nidulans FGSC A4]|eukprot:XP_868799.1 predicted protein [Aspergillus nidulans FGSC A4]
MPRVHVSSNQNCYKKEGL